MKVISAKEAGEKSFAALDELLGIDLTQVMEAIKDTIAEGKFQVTIDRIEIFPEPLLLRLRALGYDVKYGVSCVRNEFVVDKSKLIISWV